MCFLVVSSISYGQKTFRTQGEAQVRMEDSMSKQEARNNAKQKAMINAIEAVLGTYVEQETNIDVEGGETSFKIIGNTKVKGEWIETKDENYTEDTRIVKGEFGNEIEIWVTCKISGKVREIVKASLNFEILTLNCESTTCRQTDFRNDESMYVHFRSPSAGNLSIYLQEGDEVFRLLPYAQMKDEYINAVPILPDNSYLFFSAKQNHDYFPGFAYSMVDELELYTEKDKEYMKMIIVFSTKPFIKPILNDGKVVEESYAMPKSLPLAEFEDWIVKNRIYNSDFNYKEINISIKK